jgi:hypothetical protein
MKDRIILSAGHLKINFYSDGASRLNSKEKKEMY